MGGRQKTKKTSQHKGRNSVNLSHTVHNSRMRTAWKCHNLRSNLFRGTSITLIDDDERDQREQPYKDR